MSHSRVAARIEADEIAHLIRHLDLHFRSSQQHTVDKTKEHCVVNMFDNLFS